MKIKKLVVGKLDTNCYIVIKNKQCFIIDPGDEALKIISEINDLKVLTILITHNHFDHVGALDYLLNYYVVDKNNYELIDDMQVVNTPGHTKDSKTFYFPKESKMFCGDFLFESAFGRIDLGGSKNDMKESLKLIAQYPGEITLYPGHGNITTLAHEKENIKEYINYLT